jgi:Fe2+ or Zn2+ uptake regulation protein
LDLEAAVRQFPPKWTSRPEGRRKRARLERENRAAAVLNIVVGRPGALTADEIVEALEHADITMSRATVYRALRDLETQGWVRKEGRTGRGGRVVWHARGGER